MHALVCHLDAASKPLLTLQAARMTFATSAKTVLYERYVPVIPDEFKIYE